VFGKVSQASSIQKSERLLTIKQAQLILLTFVEFFTWLIKDYGSSWRLVNIKLKTDKTSQTRHGALSHIFAHKREPLSNEFTIQEKGL